MRPASTALALMISTSMLLTACGEKAPAPKAEPADMTKMAKDLFPATAEPAALATPVAPTTVVATVNGQAVTRGEVDREVQSYLMRMQGRASPERIAQMRPELEEQARENLITRNLLAAAAETGGIKVGDEDVNEAIEKLRKNSPDDTKLEDVLAKVGMTMETFRTQLASDLRINKLLEQQTTNVALPTEEQLQSYYTTNSEQFARAESVRASHILIATKEDATPEAKAEKRKKADEIRAKLVAGADFADLARQESDCPSKAQGGDLGSFRSGQMVPAFEKAAFSQKPGDIGEVVETQFGYHIIKVASHDQPGKIEFAEVKDRLSSYLASQGRQEAVRKYIASLREKATIKTLP